jgi:DNA-binding protein H-NS
VNIFPRREGNNPYKITERLKMIDEFNVMFMYRKIQAEAATTDIKTLNQLLKKFRKVVEERREEYYQEIGEEKARKLRMKRLLKLMEKDRVSPEELCSFDSGMR